MSAAILQMVNRKRAAQALEAEMRERQKQIIEMARGEKGDSGDAGPMPEHQWKGTKLRFQQPDGTWGKWTDLRGKDGESGAVIVSQRASSSGSAGMDASSLPPLPLPALLSDTLVIVRNGIAHGVTLADLQSIFGGSALPANAVLTNGEAVRVNGQLVTVT